MGTTPPADPNPYFGPHSVLRRTSGEAVLLLSGGRALLLQIAHPLVAAGVAEHSRFQQDPMGRLDRTLDTMMAMVVGSGRQADAALRRLRAVHIPVRGRLTAPSDPSPPAPLTAATTGAAAVGPLHPDGQHPRGLPTLRPAPLPRRAGLILPGTPPGWRSMGIPEEIVPGTEAEHRRYMEGMLGSGVLVVDPVARSIAGRCSIRMSGCCPGPWGCLPASAPPVCCPKPCGGPTGWSGMNGGGGAGRPGPRSPAGPSVNARSLRLMPRRGARTCCSVSSATESGRVRVGPAPLVRSSPPGAEGDKPLR